MASDVKKSHAEILRMAAEVAAKTAIDTYNKERNKAQVERVDRRLRNTKLLLRNYRMFKAHCESAVYEIELHNESIYDILEDMDSNNTEFYVESIKKSAARTTTIIKHIDVMLQLYETYCAKSNNAEEERRYLVIKYLYIDDDPMTIREVADQLHVTDRTVYRDIDIACERLAALIFGIDGVKKT